MWIILAVVFVAVIVLGWLLFRHTLNLFQHIGPLYWITRDDGSRGAPVVAWAYALSIGPEYKIGNGVQFRLGRHTFQIGLCKDAPVDPDDEIASLEYMLSYNPRQLKHHDPAA